MRFPDEDEMQKHAEGTRNVPCTPLFKNIEGRRAMILG